MKDSERVSNSTGGGVEAHSVQTGSETLYSPDCHKRNHFCCFVKKVSRNRKLETGPSHVRGVMPLPSLTRHATIDRMTGARWLVYLWATRMMNFHEHPFSLDRGF